MAVLALAAAVAAALAAAGPDLSLPRAVHTATALGDGRVLVAGGCTRLGCEGETASTELFEPRESRFAPGAPMRRPRAGHEAVGLVDGTVLVVGGWSGGSPTATAELFTGGAFVETAPMRLPRGGFAATPLHDGRVLVTGGTDGRRLLRSAEVYDPASRRFADTGTMRLARAAHTATRLHDGRVLVVGGSSAAGSVHRSAELYDPKTGRFSPAGDLVAGRHKHAAVVLRDGRVLVVGGSDERDFAGRYATAEAWSPSTRRFRPAGRMAAPRFKLPGAVVLLPSGEVLVAGGGSVLEAWNPQTGRFRVVAEAPAALSFATASPLRDGTVLVAGGYDETIDPARGTLLVRPR